MSIVNADLGELLQAANGIKTAISSIEKTKSSMSRKYQQLGNEWKDKKYKELGDVVQECNKALEYMLKVLTIGETHISSLVNSLREYENINIGSSTQSLTRHITSAEESSRWESTIQNVNELIDVYRKEMILNGAFDGALLTRFLAKQRAEMLQYEGQVLEVARGNRPELINEEIYQYVICGENSPYNYSDLVNDFGDFCVNEISSWVSEINPNPNNDPRRKVNCGKCAAAVYQRINGNNSATAGLGTYSISEMNEITGRTQTTMTPAQIENYLREQGVGSHVVVGVDRASGSGHWFNAFFDGRQIYTIEGQGGYLDGWPPDYGNVVHWDISI